jgi:hypothetical protein
VQARVPGGICSFLCSLSLFQCFVVVKIHPAAGMSVMPPRRLIAVLTAPYQVDHKGQHYGPASSAGYLPHYIVADEVQVFCYEFIAQACTCNTQGKTCHQTETTAWQYHLREQACRAPNKYRQQQPLPVMVKYYRGE